MKKTILICILKRYFFKKDSIFDLLYSMETKSLDYSSDQLKELIGEKRLDQMETESEKIFRIKLINHIREDCSIDPFKIVFLGFSGNYDCNLKYISDYILKKHSQFCVVWGTFEHNNLNDKDNFPSNVKVLVRESYEFYKELSSAKYIFDNSINMISIGYEKKPDQVLVETWHGAMGIKLFGPSGNNDFEWHRLAEQEGKMTDFILSNSKLENDVYRRTFWKNTNILEFGHARNDLFFKGFTFKREIKRKICERYRISKNKKICLFAPTFRDDHNLDVYMFDGIKLKEILSKRFGGEWEILCRYHDGIVRTYWDKIRMPKGVINVSDYPDIQELAFIADAGVTDYSSWIFEYLLRKKPGFIFAKDYENYVKNERKLLFPLEEAPFTIATNEESLFINIKKFDFKSYKHKVKVFIKKHGNVDKGKAAKLSVEYILKNK